MSLSSRIQGTVGMLPPVIPWIGAKAQQNISFSFIKAFAPSLPLSLVHESLRKVSILLNRDSGQDQGAL